MHVFTYGTLMFPEVWTSVAGRGFDSVAGELRGFSAYRVKEAVYPGMVAESAASSVQGIVYLNVVDAALVRLDRFEDDFYVRQSLTIDCEDGQQRLADAYVVPPDRKHVLTDEPWTRESFIAGGGLEQFIRRFAGFARVAEGEER